MVWALEQAELKHHGVLSYFKSLWELNEKAVGPLLSWVWPYLPVELKMNPAWSLIFLEISGKLFVEDNENGMSWTHWF